MVSLVRWDEVAPWQRPMRHGAHGRRTQDLRRRHGGGGGSGDDECCEWTKGDHEVEEGGCRGHL